MEENGKWTNQRPGFAPQQYRGDQLPEQERIATTYLREKQKELLALAQFPGVEGVNLGFVYRMPAMRLASALVRHKRS
jgi:hypothetical protein